MPARDFPNLGLKGGYEPHEDGWAEDMNLNLLKLSVLSQGGVIDKVAVEPGAPAAGDVYILDETHATHPNEIIVFDGPAGEEAWVYLEPNEGWLVYNRTANYYEKFDGAVWSELATGGGGGGGVEEAPEDGALYGRRDAAWEEIIGGGGEGGVLPFAGARVGRSATTNFSTTGAWTPIQWNVEHRDTSNLWDVGAPSRFTIPAGVTKIRLMAGFQIDAADQADNNQFTFRKNGSDFPSGRVIWSFGGGGYTNPGCFGVSDVIDVVPGDYFECVYFISASLSVTSSAFFAIELVERGATNAGLNLNLDEVLDVDAAAPADGDCLIFNSTTGKWEPGVPTVSIDEGTDYNRPFRGALAYFNANKSSATLPYFPAWDATEYDTDGFWSAANPSRLTIPAGIKKVRLSALLHPEGTGFTADNERLVWDIYKNGAVFRGSGQSGSRMGYYNVGITIQTAVINVVPGDYFEVRFNSGTAATKTYSAQRSYFSLEVVETETTP